jgi:hypothetical protein
MQNRKNDYSNLICKIRDLAIIKNCFSSFQRIFAMTSYLYYRNYFSIPITNLSVPKKKVSRAPRVCRAGLKRKPFQGGTVVPTASTRPTDPAGTPAGHASNSSASKFYRCRSVLLK